MDRLAGAPQIASQGTKFANVDITQIAYADPDKFPLGLEVMVMAPGDIQPLGRGPIPKGFGLALIGPEGARVLRDAYRQLATQLPPGAVRPPGM